MMFFNKNKVATMAFNRQLEELNKQLQLMNQHLYALEEDQRKQAKAHEELAATIGHLTTEVGIFTSSFRKNQTVVVIRAAGIDQEAFKAALEQFIKDAVANKGFSDGS